MNSLSFDGFGINYGPGSDHTGERIATFTNTEGSPVYRGNDETWRERQRLGHLFEAAPELLAVCRKAEEAMAEVCDCGECGGCAVTEEIRDTIAEATGGKPEATTTTAPAPDRLPDALVALQECVDLLRNSKVQWKICDGGRGNLGEASRYHSAMRKANAVLYPTR